MENAGEDRLAAGNTAAEALPLEIDLLGRWEARLHGRPLALRYRKDEWLLAFLALRAGGAVERVRLAGIFWPESSETHALFYLRRSLTHLRRALGEEAVRLGSPTPHTLALDLTGARIDALRFDELVTRRDLASLEAAVTLYRGPLLPGCVETWVLTERQPREEAYLTALQTLAAAARKQPAAAARFLRLAVAVDPLRETAQRALMASLADAGDYAAATLVYREFRLLLHRELNLDPGPETAALFAQIRAQARAQPPPATPRSKYLRPHTRPPTASTLPHPISSFVGRESETAEIATVVAATRLVTLTGAGGVGKTRLALQVAEEIADEYPDGACFVDLAGLTDPTLVPPAVARRLGITEQAGQPLIQTLVHSLEPRAILLILDNCEHLLAACADLARTLLTGCPHLRIVATSRQSLGVTGETVWQVPPLSLPPVAESASLGDDQRSRLMQYEAVRLFAERGTAAARSFTLSEENVTAIVDLCRRLDGIPLAIELAAAWLKVLTVEQIAVRLQDRFRLLAVGSRAASPRHQTLAAMLDWSYALLSEPERALLRRLAVFAGGFTLEAAEAVGSGPWTGDRCDRDSDPELSPAHGPRSTDVLELLGRLIDKSLVMADGGGTVPPFARGEGGRRTTEIRYRLLEMVRQYARDRLLEAGEAAAARDRHRDWFVALAERAEPVLWSHPAWLDRLETEHDNLRAALEWCAETVHSGSLNHQAAATASEAGLRLAGALWWFWYIRSHYTEARQRLETALAGSQALGGAGRAEVSVRWKALCAAGQIAADLGEIERATALGEESLALCRQAGDKAGQAWSLHVLAEAACHQGDWTAMAALEEESLALFRAVDDKRGMGLALGLYMVGSALGHQGYVDRARARTEESLALCRKEGYRWLSAVTLYHLGHLELHAGRPGRARMLLEESLAIHREHGNRAASSESLLGLWEVAHATGDAARAMALLEESLALSQECGAKSQTAEALIHLGHHAFARGECERARASFEEALRLARELGARRQIAEALLVLQSHFLDKLDSEVRGSDC